ncbi:MAG TPA: hypothetical protein VHG10_12410 [Glycomyces sp.]|nr:hypothetical protein [Glycomyces sp.]
MTAQDPNFLHIQPPGGSSHPVQPGPPVHGYQQPYYPQPHPAYAMQQQAWPPMAAPAPAMIDGFYLVQPRLKPIPSGPAIGSLIAGIAGFLGSVPGLISAAFSPWAGLTFFMSAALFGIGSVSLAVYARRQVRASRGGVSGGGVALTGLIFGIVACSFAGLTGLIALASA